MKLAWGPIVARAEDDSVAARDAAVAQMQALVDEAVARADAERDKGLAARYGYRAARRARRAS